MKVRLDQLGDEPYSWRESLALPCDQLGIPELLDLSEVACRGRLCRTTPGFLLEMALSYTQELECMRCLGRVTVPVESQVDLLVLPEDKEATAETGAVERELMADDLGVLALEGQELDTRPLVVEHAQLQVPMRALCRDDCAGLCPSCGADKNAGSCDCQPPADPRWAALSQRQKGA